MSALLAAAAALALAAPPDCGLPPLRPGPPPFAPGERLRYDVDVMGVVKAGTLWLSVERPMFEGQELPLKARVRNTSVFAKVRQITGVAFSWTDARTLRPERYRDEVVENGVRKISDARIQAGDPRITIENRFGDRAETISFDRQGEVLDALSFLYLLRAADLGPGRRLCFDLVANRRYWRVSAQVAAAGDRVETGAGIYDTLRVDATATRADQPAARRPLHIWISTDARRLPVAVVSEVDLGPVRAMLVGVTP